jgi:hypothetical protein
VLGVVRPPVRHHLRVCEAGHRLLAAGDVAPERLVAPHMPVQQQMNQFGRRVFGFAQLLGDHAALFFDVGRVEARAQQHIGEHIERALEVKIGHFGVTDRGVEAGVGVQNTADALDRVGDLLGSRAAFAALE